MAHQLNGGKTMHLHLLSITALLATLTAASVAPGSAADKLVDESDALLIRKLQAERDAAYKGRDDASAARDAAEATAQRLAADEAAKAGAAARTECEAALAAALEKATAASAAALKQTTNAHAAATKDANAQHAAALEAANAQHAVALKEANDKHAALALENTLLRDEHDRALTAKDQHYVAAQDGALAALNEQHRSAVKSVEAAARERMELVNSKHDAVRASLERRLKEDTDQLTRRHAEELAREAVAHEAATTAAVAAAITAQNHKHAEAIEAELAHQESDFLVWHGDEIRRRRPLNRLKRLVGSIRKGQAAPDQKKITFRKTISAAPAESAEKVTPPPESKKKKGWFRFSKSKK